MLEFVEGAQRDVYHPAHFCCSFKAPKETLQVVLEAAIKEPTLVIIEATIIFFESHNIEGQYDIYSNHYLTRFFLTGFINGWIANHKREHPTWHWTEPDDQGQDTGKNVPK